MERTPRLGRIVWREIERRAWAKNMDWQRRSRSVLADANKDVSKWQSAKTTILILCIYDIVFSIQYIIIEGNDRCEA